MNTRIPTLACLAFASAAFAAEIKSSPDRESFARNNPTREGVPVEAFQFDPALAKDLQIEVWATTPQIYTPVAMDVDAQGRVWATEGIDYGQKPRVAAGQSIIVLEDKDGDGKADSSHVFVTEKGLRAAPLGIAVFDNQIVFSATPSIIVYTDVNRNAVFDPDTDKREVFLTGFNGGTHDHTLHAVIGGPDGSWYFSHGNKGLDVTTTDGRHFFSGCYYGSPELIGKRSSDGRVHMGGMSFRIQPDGTGLRVIGENMRNTHDMFVNSFGDVFQSDNDDPAHCRITWLMEHANMGYADIQDGSKSWEEIAKSWEEPGMGKDFRRRSSASHWRENYPGTTPPGNVYGIGSPTGNVFIEGDELGEAMCGQYLVCDMVLKQVMASHPQPHGAGVAIGKLSPFLSLKSDQQHQFFLPSDLALLPDGSLLLADFYNDTSRRTIQVSGTIYRISRRDAKMPAAAKIDFTTTDGLIAALRSPVINVRSHAAQLLKSKGDAITPALIAFFEKETNPFLQARAIWPLAHTTPTGRASVTKLLTSGDESQRIAAFRALREADPTGLPAVATIAAKDASAALRREVALALLDVPFEQMKDIAAQLISGYDSKDRWYVEALGAAATGKETQFYDELVRPAVASKSPAEWPEATLNLAWRLHTPAACNDLLTYLKTSKPDIATFRHYLMAFATFRSDKEREANLAALNGLLKEPTFSGPEFQTTLNEIIQRDLTVLEGTPLTFTSLVPKTFGAKSKVSDIATIAKLEGNVERGKSAAMLCTVCHRIAGQGVPFGPNLDGWGKARTIEHILKEIILPNDGLAHGFDKPARITSPNGKHVAEGFISNYSFHAGTLNLKMFGGVTKKILFRKGRHKVEELKTSWMPSAADMGLSDQMLRDIAEYLQTLE
ncbi:MAG: c-type cytochrome [Verrucomicrobiaceae bacterium]|nr:c-type cytochrome [Verrucomicrobiaceae bacterium]